MALNGARSILYRPISVEDLGLFLPVATWISMSRVIDRCRGSVQANLFLYFLLPNRHLLYEDRSRRRYASRWWFLVRGIRLGFSGRGRRGISGTSLPRVARVVASCPYKWPVSCCFVHMVYNTFSAFPSSRGLVGGGNCESFCSRPKFYIGLKLETVSSGKA